MPYRSILELLLKFLQRELVVVDVDWLVNRLQALPNFEFRRWFPLDGRFITTRRSKFEKLAKAFAEKRVPYIMEIFDCDDFSFHFKAWIAREHWINAVAVVIDYGSAHAYNIAFPHDSPPVIIEPQTGDVIEIDRRDTRFYGLKNYFILI